MILLPLANKTLKKNEKIIALYTPYGRIILQVHRGVNGLYIYAVDEELRNALLNADQREDQE